MDGMEITQFTYFQQAGGIDLAPISVELTYGLERIAMYLQGVRSVYDLEWGHGVTYGDLYRLNEAPVERVQLRGRRHRRRCSPRSTSTSASAGAASRPAWSLPAYDQVLKCSHAFNLLDARGVISVTERGAYIWRVRTLASRVARAWLELDRPRPTPEAMRA